MKRWAAAVALLALTTLSAAPVSPNTGQGIGVAPFDRVAPAGVELPDVASMLAERLSARGVAPVIGPAGVDGAATDASPAALARRYGVQAGVAAVVTGRLTRLGRRSSLDVRLRSATSGETLATWVEESTDPAALPEAVDRLAGRIAARVPHLAAAPTATPPPDAAAAAPTSTPPPDTAAAAATPPVDAAPAAPQPAAVGPAPALPLDPDAPISIRAEELEAFQEGGARRLVFQRNVRVVQKDVTLRAQRLEALYPRGESQPERLVANGRVRVAQGERSMDCREATFFRAEQRVLCVGDAELRQGADRVRGARIEIWLGSGRVRVSGGAEVNVRAQAATGTAR